MSQQFAPLAITHKLALRVPLLLSRAAARFVLARVASAMTALMHSVSYAITHAATAARISH